MGPHVLNFGCFESHAKAWAVEGIPEEFCFDELPEDLDHVMPYMQATLARVPLLREVGIRKSFNGPESFTPDVQYLLGETPELQNLYVACGFNSIGIGSAGGAGYALAAWIVNGGPTMDLSDLALSPAGKRARCAPVPVP
jgi:4-methylaminobutanoate oxidase (formaldehyde-forming)